MEMKPSVFNSVDEAIEKLKLSKRVKWKIYLGYLCRYTKRDICPEFVIDNGLPVEIIEKQTITPVPVRKGFGYYLFLGEDDSPATGD